MPSALAVRPRLLVSTLALLTLAAVAGPASAQTACVDGTAAAYPCEGVDLLAHLPRSAFTPDPPSRNNDIWGWTDPQDGSEYALVGLNNGTAFVDVTEPTAPVYLGKLPTATTAATWRDVKTSGNYAFIVADGAFDHGMQVFDLTRLRDVQSPPVVFTADANYNGVSGNRPNSSHNVVIDEEAELAALVGSDDCAGGLHLVDIADPLNPTFQSCYSNSGYSHDAQCLTYSGPDADYAGHPICVGFNTDRVAFVDVSDPTDPVLISEGFYPSPAYTHQGWFTEDQRYVLVDDEIDDFISATTRTIVMDVEDLDNPEFDFAYFGPLEVTDHNLYVRGQYAFLSNYEGGLRIVDLSGIDSGTLVEVASFDTYPEGDEESYNGQWSNYPYFESGTIIANDRDNGLFVLEPTGLALAAELPPSGPMPVLSAPVPNPASARTTLSLTVPEPVDVVAEVLDLQGRRVALLYEGPATPSAPLALTVDGADLPSGLYLVRVTGPRFTATRRVSFVQ